jgi:hypothetical protein
VPDRRYKRWHSELTLHAGLSFGAESPSWTYAVRFPRGTYYDDVLLTGLNRFEATYTPTEVLDRYCFSLLALPVEDGGQAITLAERCVENGLTVPEDEVVP